MPIAFVLSRAAFGLVYNAHRRIDMEDIDEAKVFVLLLSFSALSKAERAAFIDGVNEYLHTSPAGRRSLTKLWRSIDADFPDPDRDESAQL